MSIKQLKKCFLLTAVALLCAFSSNAQETFERGKLYHIYGAGETENIVAEKMGEMAGLVNYDKEDPCIYWKISELSGSWRIINPVTNNALRVNGNLVEVGENNGSDEAQLWKFENGLIIPANNPTLAIAKGKGGTLVVIKKERAANMRAAKFKIKESEVAGFDDDLTYQICPVTKPGQVLGNGDSGENNARIVCEDTVSGNKGQYWNIKTIDLFTFAVENAFYGIHFDDGGDNASIDYLLQWPATAGVWNNAKFHFEP
jgi:beta-galactosidase